MHVSSERRIPKIIQTNLTRPVNTYRGKGTLRKGVISDCHAMIYHGEFGTEPPELLPGEQLILEAIRVQPSKNGELDPAARINFGKQYAVEHNVKVLDLGVVSDEAQHNLRVYFSQALTH